MVKQSNRRRRVAQQLQREVALILQREMQSSQLKMTTVSEVQVSGDLQYAKIYVTFFENTPEAIERNMAELEESTSYIRSLLASVLRMRLVPNIKFLYDNTMAEGLRMSHLIHDAISDDQKRRDDMEESNAPPSSEKD